MKKSSFIEGTIISTVAIVVVKLLGMLYVIPFYKMVGTQGGSLYSYAYNIYNIFLDISTAGIPIAVSKIINEYNTLGYQEAKIRTFKIGKKILMVLAIVIFLALMLFAPSIASLLLGDLEGGNTISDVTTVIRCISFAILVVPFLSVSKGYLQGHKIFNISSLSQVIEQVIRITVILLGTYIVVNVFDAPILNAICIALSGAFLGGLVAYIFVAISIRRSKKNLGFVEYKKQDNITNKEIIKKIFSYAIPFIIINGISSLYNFVDMTLILRTLATLNIDAKTVEFIASSISTWSPKITMVITSMAMGLTVSLIPTIVTAFAKKDWEDVTSKLNQALQVILFVSIPMAVGISMLSKEIWSIFYGNAMKEGAIILGLSTFTCLVANVYMVSSSTLQGLNKFKLVYKTTIIGFCLNMFLDVPLMLLYNKIGLPPYLGATTASIIGYSSSVYVTLSSLRKEHNLKYKKTLNILKKIFIPLITMIIVVLITKAIIPVNVNSKTSCIIFVGINAIIGAITYLLISYKMNIITDVFGKSAVNKILKKLTFGKVRIEK